jgi:hypothetical protein
MLNGVMMSAKSGEVLNFWNELPRAVCYLTSLTGGLAFNQIS